METCDLMAKIRLDPIIPKGKILDGKKLERELHDALDHTANIIRDDFHKTTDTWHNKPDFKKIGPRSTFGQLEVIVETRDEIYSYVEYGTRPHVIVPKKRGGRLAFRGKYVAKTRPGVISSRAGGAKGGLRFAKQVQHPGTQPRHFSATIAKRRQKNLLHLVRLAYMKSLK
jgi:hypothetical protein